MLSLYYLMLLNPFKYFSAKYFIRPNLETRFYIINIYGTFQGDGKNTIEKTLDNK